jgi:hypothetical protein
MPFVDLLHFKNNSTDLYVAKKFGEKKGKIISKKSAEKKPKSLKFGEKIPEPEKNCRDFLIPKIFVRFFQSNLPLDANTGVQPF